MVKEISVIDLKNKLEKKENFILLDIRRADELLICSLAEAKHIEMNDLPNRIDELDKDAEYIIMCRSGARSFQTTMYMQQQDFTNVANLKGGILDWADQIDPSMQKY